MAVYLLYFKKKFGLYILFQLTSFLLIDEVFTNYGNL